MSSHGRYQLILVVLCAAAYLPNLGATHLWDEDEAYFGRTVQEMEARGDYVVPYFDGAISLHKPALMYWVMIVSRSVFGRTEFALRIGSVLFSTGCVLLTFHLGRLLFSPRAGFWSAAALATCLQFMVVARAAVADPELMFFTTLPILLFVSGMRSGGQGADATRETPLGAARLSWLGWAMAYASMGVAGLAKGPVGIVLPTAVIGLYLLFEQADRLGSETAGLGYRQTLWAGLNWMGRVFWPPTIVRTTWSMRPLTALLAIGVVAAPWYTAVGLYTDGEWLRGFLLVHNVGRFSKSLENHSGGLAYYPIAIAIGTFPWCLFGYLSLRKMALQLQSDGPQRQAYLLLCAWIVVWVATFTMAGTKLPHYVLPAYPAVALILGAFLDEWLSSTADYSRFWLRASWGTLMVVGIGILIAMPLVALKYAPNEQILALIGLLPLMAGAIGYACDVRQRRAAAGATLLISAATFGVVLLAWAAVRVDRYQNGPQIASWLNELSPGRNPTLATYGYHEASLLYYCDRRHVASCSDPAGVERFFDEHPEDAYLLTTQHREEQLADALPTGLVALRTTRRFPKSGTLVLIGRAEPSSISLSSSRVVLEAVRE